MKNQLLIIFLLALMAVVSCRRIDERISQNDVPVDLALQLTTQKPNIVDPTKSNVDQGVVKDVNVWVFDQAGTMLNNYFIADIANSPFVIRTTSGLRYFVFLANFGSKIDGITTLNAINSLTYTNLTPVELTYTPMAKITDLITVPSPAASGTTVTLDPIELVRLTAKVTITFDNSGLNSNVKVTPTKIVLRQVPNVIPLFANNNPSTIDKILQRGDSLEVVSGIVSTDHTTAKPIFMLENQQGITSNTDPKTKTPPAGKDKFTTYVEITADYKSLDKSGKILYRFYLGQNATNNFNILRNTWYQMSVFFKGKGGVNENTWRVDVGGVEDKFIPKTYYMPYMSGRANYYMLSSAWLTNIATISGDNPVIHAVDSVRAILFKKDFLNNSLNYFGDFIPGAPTPNYPVYGIGDQLNDAFIDVSTLMFPKNARFGSKNYYVTQYINLMNITNQPKWKVLSSADWLYLGDGANVNAFTYSGTASTTGYTNMKNFSAGELLSTEVANNSIAVRCTDNTSSVQRRGQIIFYDKNDIEFARVYVNQNPSTYPISPVHLAYVPAGIIRAGAFNSAAAVPTTLPTDASTANIYAFISPFYVASKETTTQQFTDFLNDVGITNVAQLGLMANTILGKIGLFTDYLGLNPPSLFVQLNATTGMLSYTGGKWVPAKKQFYRSFNVVAAGTASVANYPINEVGFYTSADCNYWAMKYSGKTPNRLTDPLLITELEWETAARGISNRETVLANFTASTNTRKNGAYPYAASWYSSYNSGMTGTESGNIDVLGSFLWFSNGSEDGAKSSGGLVASYLHPSGNLFPNEVGTYDMNGNVSEWVFDNYNGLLGQYSFSLNVLNSNVFNISINTERVIRGGDVNRVAKYDSNVARSFTSPNSLNPRIGFRMIIR